MPFRVTCPHCSAPGTVPETARGRKVRCASCGTKFTAPPADQPPGTIMATPLATWLPAALAEAAPRSAPPSPPPAGAHPPSSSVPCPFCGEQVLPAAKKCKHCHEVLDVALREVRAEGRKA